MGGAMPGPGLSKEFDKWIYTHIIVISIVALVALLFFIDDKAERLSEKTKGVEISQKQQDADDPPLTLQRLPWIWMPGMW